MRKPHDKKVVNLVSLSRVVSFKWLWGEISPNLTEQSAADPSCHVSKDTY